MGFVEKYGLNKWFLKVGFVTNYDLRDFSTTLHIKVFTDIVIYNFFFHRGLEEKIQILKNKPLLKDYSNTFIDIDETQRRLELEEPYSGKSREKCKTSKSGL